MKRDDKKQKIKIKKLEQAFGRATKGDVEVSEKKFFNLKFNLFKLKKKIEE